MWDLFRFSMKSKPNSQNPADHSAAAAKNQFAPGGRTQGGSVDQKTNSDQDPRQQKTAKKPHQPAAFFIPKGRQKTATDCPCPHTYPGKCRDQTVWIVFCYQKNRKNQLEQEHHCKAGQKRNQKANSHNAKPG